MRKLLCCAASAAALILVANAADTAAPQKKVPATGAARQATPPAAASKTASLPKAVPKTLPKAAPKQPVTKQAWAKPAGTGTAASRNTTGARRTTSTLPRRPTTSWRNRQVAPTPDRYKEIQEALASKGYLQSEDATGKWDQGSVEALKRFQADQKLDSTGKLNSLSLIALGLGPKHDAPAPAKPADPPIGQR